MTTPIVIDRFDGDFHFLSNFEMWSLKYKDMVFRSSEHAYQSEKSTSPGYRLYVQNQLTAGSAKQLGRRAQLRPDWEEIKVGVMEAILKEKFSHPELKRRLLATGDAVLIEGNWWHDNFWGNCTCERRECQPPGENMLGQLLMKLRGELQHG